MASRSYSVGTRAALITLCGGTCYWPGCVEPVVIPVNGRYRVALQIAHICALELGGPRYDASLSIDARNSFGNLILLCVVHHQEIDEGGEVRFPTDLLRRWKSDREKTRQAALEGLSRVTRDELQELITDAFTKRQEQLEATLARLDRNDAEAAVLLRELRDELVEVRRHGVAVDADAAYMLSNAANKLGNLEDSASMLARAADGLGNLEDTASMLSSAADELRGLEDVISQLRSAASDLRNASGFM